MTRTSLLLSVESSDERVSSPLALGLPWSMLGDAARRVYGEGRLQRLTVAEKGTVPELTG